MVAQSAFVVTDPGHAPITTSRCKLCGQKAVPVKCAIIVALFGEPSASGSIADAAERQGPVSAIPRLYPLL